MLKVTIEETNKREVDVNELLERMEHFRVSVGDPSVCFADNQVIKDAVEVINHLVDNDDMEMEIEKLLSENQRVLHECEKAKKEYNKMYAEISNYECDRMKADKEISDLKTENKALAEKVRRYRYENDDLREKLYKLESTYAELKKRHELLRSVRGMNTQTDGPYYVYDKEIEELEQGLEEWSGFLGKLGRFI